MELISIDSIKTNNKYLRLGGDVEKLVRSIDAVGTINPLIINNDNELLAGGRRYTAMQELGHSEVPVHRVDKTPDEQELISIDENLVRRDLNKVEFEECLYRANQIYNNIYPNLPTMEEEIEAEKTNPEERLTEKETFLEFTQKKTGLSKKAIKSAIDREKQSAPTIKSARLSGDLNASQTNEIIKLDEEDQEKIIDIAKGKSAADIRKMVKKVQQIGFDSAMNVIQSEKPLLKEYKNINTLVGRLNKLSSTVILEEIVCEHETKGKILEAMMLLRNQLDELIKLNSGSNSSNDSDDYDDHNISHTTNDSDNDVAESNY
ncbi:MAG: ParB family chromosome partitioning protein [Thermoproteota archaeon]|jgi:ParB family chromosome partitioning protein